MSSSNRPTPPPPSETKLKEAIDNLISTAGCVASAERGEQWGSVGSLLCNRNAARSSLESLYREQIAEIDRLKLIQFSPSGDNHHNAALCPYCSPKQIADRDKWIEEIRALRSLQLTPDDLGFIFENLDHGKFCSPPKDCVCNYFGILAKLRRISSKATSEEL